MRIYALSTIISTLLVIFVGIQAGIGALILVLILAALELTFSVDNAVVNTRILERLSSAWQQAFLTVGMVIAVFGVRVLLPLLIVSIASGLSMGSVVDLALNHPDEYGHQLEVAHPYINAFGGVFLLMLFLDFFLQKRPTKWLVGVEEAFEKAGKLESLSIIVPVATLLGASAFLNGHEQQVVLISGFIGLASYLAISTLDTVLAKSGVNKNLQKHAKNTFKAGLIGFLYLNIVDASFSLDGVIGAFAITDQILLIAVGLGIGALYVRVLTLHMLQHGVLDKYKYMEHGAHYAIGILAILMLVSLLVNVPEAVAGLAGIAFVATAVIHSVIEAKASKKRA